MALLQNISKERKKELPLLMALGDGTRPETAYHLHDKLFRVAGYL